MHVSTKGDGNPGIKQQSGCNHNDPFELTASMVGTIRTRAGHGSSARSTVDSRTPPCAIVLFVIF